MLPGFRFLFAAIVLSMSILVFGLGAAALLRAAHEEFANLPTRRAPPEPMFARRIEPAMPTLAMLRVDPPEPEKPVDTFPAAAAPEIVAEIPTPAEQAREAAPAESEKLAALKLEEPTPLEAAKPETPAMETIGAAPDPAAPETPAAETELKLAAIAETPEPAAKPTSMPPEPANDVLSLDGSVAAIRIATLGGPAVIIDEATSARTSEAKPDRSAIRKRMARRAKERRRLAQQARLAREAAALAARQPQLDPFSQAPFARATR